MPGTHLVERLVAHGTLVRLFHAVRELVVLVVALLVESLAAVLASVRLVTRVYPRVRVERRTSVESLAANGARVRFLLGVYDLVPAQRGRLPETLAAHLRPNQKPSGYDNNINNFLTATVIACDNPEEISDDTTPSRDANGRLRQ